MVAADSIIRVLSAPESSDQEKAEASFSSAVIDQIRRSADKPTTPMSPMGHGRSTTAQASHAWLIN